MLQRHLSEFESSAQINMQDGYKMDKLHPTTWNGGMHISPLHSSSSILIPPPPAAWYGPLRPPPRPPATSPPMVLPIGRRSNDFACLPPSSSPPRCTPATDRTSRIPNRVCWAFSAEPSRDVQSESKYLSVAAATVRSELRADQPFPC